MLPTRSWVASPVLLNNAGQLQKACPRMGAGFFVRVRAAGLDAPRRAQRQHSGKYSWLPQACAVPLHTVHKVRGTPCHLLQ